MYKRIPLDEKGQTIKSPNFNFGPRNLVVTSFPKSGKTLALTDIPGVLIGDLESGTKDFGSVSNVANMRTEVNAEPDQQDFIKLASNGAFIPRGIFETVDDLRKANRMDKYWQLQNAIDLSRNSEEKEKLTKELLELIQSMPYPVFCVDTITSIQELNNQAALMAYNEGVSKENKKKDIKKVDNYSGVRFTRRNFDFLKSFIEKNSAPYIIWFGHTGARKKILEKSETEISVADIALDGLQSTIFTANSNANAILYRDDKGVWLDFRKKEETDFGSRTPFLANRLIKIADLLSEEDLKEGKRPTTYWHEVYPELVNKFQKR